MAAGEDALFRALADPTRRGIFERLCREGDTTVGALTAGAGVSQPVVSKHLRVLAAAGLVQGRPSGRRTQYRARPDGLAPLADWTRDMARFWEGRIDALEGLLRRIDQ
jgi:DNA-binding transcriptional ArsR family regulator